MGKFIIKTLPIAVGLGVAIVSFRLLDEYVLKPLYKET